jgi:dihydroflavonol-4-reductase
MKERVLVTGADGMLGSNLVRELLARQYIVRALIQPGRLPKTLDGLDVELVNGDVLNIVEIEHAMMQCDYVIHAAASTAIWPSRSRIVYDINLEGTMNVVWAATKQHIKRLVHVSSAGVFAAGSKTAPGDELGAFTGHCYGLDYINSKYDAQKVVMKAVHCGLNAVIVNPTFMLGPYDSTPGSGSVILAVSKGKILANPPGGKNFICVRDVAVATCNALTMGRSGECYILGHQNLAYKEILCLIAGIVKHRPPQISLSPTCIRLMSVLTNLVASMVHKRPLISRQVARMSCDQHFFTSGKAILELQLPQTPISKGIEEAFASFKENGYA